VAKTSTVLWWQQRKQRVHTGTEINSVKTASTLHFFVASTVTYQPLQLRGLGDCDEKVAQCRARVANAVDARFRSVRCSRTTPIAAAVQQCARWLKGGQA
jgi:hypothetical protein